LKQSKHFLVNRVVDRRVKQGECRPDENASEKRSQADVL
jgi:hypothetical protein